MIRRKTILSSLTFVCGLMLSSLLVSCDSLGGQKDEMKVDYLAVQIDENDSWSIRASCNVRTNYGSGVIMAKDFAY